MIMINDIDLFLMKYIDNVLYEKTKSEMVEGKGDVFGAAILDKELNLSIKGSNNNKYNPLLHGEIVALNNTFETLKTKDLSNFFMLSTHEPCPMCISAIYWSKIPKLYYLFSYEDTAKYFGYPEDMQMCLDMFGQSHPQSSPRLEIIKIDTTKYNDLYNTILNKYIKLKEDYINV